jgi:hypothetical protein
MKAGRLFAGFSAILLALLSAQAQGTFQNLNFESANVAASGPQLYNFVPIGSALPGWTAYLGTVQVTQVGYNCPANSTASITLIGPTWNSYDTTEANGVGIIDGNYSIDLQTGANPISPEPELINASIEQNGTVPAYAESLQFEARETTPFTVTFNGNVLSPVVLSSGVSADGVPYNLYGANISAWAGQTGELEFTADQLDENYVVLDDISFSTNSVTPEPGTLALIFLGGAALAARRWLTRGT